MFGGSLCARGGVVVVVVVVVVVASRAFSGFDVAEKNFLLKGKRRGIKK